MSPPVLRSGPYRFYFYSSDRHEPPHVHVTRGENVAKFWLEPVLMASNVGFAAAEANRIAGLVTKHQADLLGAWHDFFGTH